MIWNNHNYNHFIIKELAKDFGVQFQCLGENTEKYKTFSVSTGKEILKVDKDGNENIVTICYKIKSIDSMRFMTTSLSNLVDNPSKGIFKIKCKDCGCFFECESVNDNSINHEFLSFNKKRLMKI